MRAVTIVVAFLAGVLGSAAPVAAAPTTVERCLALIDVQLFDDTSTTQIDTISVVDVPASHTFRQGHSRRTGEFAVPPAYGTAKTMAVTGATTGREYLFSLDWEMTAVTRGNGTTRDKATITVRLTTPEGRLVAEVVSRNTLVVSSDGQVKTAFRNRTRGLPLASQFGISCDPVPRNPHEIFNEAPTFGFVTYEVVSTESGPFIATPSALVPEGVTGGTVTQDLGQVFTPGGPGTTAVPFTIPAGTAHFRVLTSFTDVVGALDLDLYLYRGDELVAESFSPFTTERIEVPDPVPGEYTLWVHGYQLFEGVADATFTLRSWTVGSDPTDTVTVRAPSQLTAGVPEYVTLFFTGPLVSGVPYLGSITHNLAGLPHRTLVNVFLP